MRKMGKQKKGDRLLVKDEGDGKDPSSDKVVQYVCRALSAGEGQKKKSRN